MEDEEYLTQVLKVYLTKKTYTNSQYQRGLSNSSLAILFLWENEAGHANTGRRNCMNYSKKWYYYLTEEPKAVQLLLKPIMGTRLNRFSAGLAYS